MDEELQALMNENASLRQALGEDNAPSTDPELEELEAKNKLLKLELQSPKEESTLSRFGRAGARLAKDVPVGAVSTLDFIASPIRGAMNYGNKLLGGDENYFQPVSETLDKKVDELTEGYTKPRNLSEKIGSEGTKALSSFMPARSIGMKLAQAAPSLAGKSSKFVKGAGDLLAGGTDPTLTNVGATTAGIAAREQMLKNEPEGHGAAFLGEITGNLGARKLSALATKGKLARSIGKATQFNTDKYKDFKDADIPSTLADVSDSHRITRVENGLRKLPFTGNVIDKVKEAQKQKISKTLGQHSNPDLLTQEHGGNLAGEAAEASYNEYRKKAKYLWDKVEKATSKTKDKTLKTPNVHEFFTEEYKSLTSKGSEKAFKESPVGKLADLFEEYHYGKDGSPKKLTFDELKDFRDKVRDKVSTWGQHGNVTQGELKQLDSRIQKDLDGYFSKISPGAKKAWKNFNRYTGDYLEHYKPIANSIREDINAREPIKAFNESLPSRDSVKKTVHVMKSLGDKAPEFWGTLMNKWGDFNGKFYPKRAATKFNKLDKSLQTKLLKNSGYSESEQRLFRKNLKAIEHFPEETNPSGSGYTMNDRKIYGKWGAAASAALVKGTGEPLTIMAPIAITAATRATAKAFVSPKLQAWINKGLTSKSEKAVPRWIEHGLRKVPGIPSSVKEEMEEIYMHMMESDKSRGVSDSRKAISMALRGKRG